MSYLKGFKLPDGLKKLCNFINKDYYYDYESEKTTDQIKQKLCQTLQQFSRCTDLKIIIFLEVVIQFNRFTMWD